MDRSPGAKMTTVDAAFRRSAGLVFSCIGMPFAAQRVYRNVVEDRGHVMFSVCMNAPCIPLNSLDQKLASSRIAERSSMLDSICLPLVRFRWSSELRKYLHQCLWLSADAFGHNHFDAMRYSSQSCLQKPSSAPGVPYTDAEWMFQLSP